MPIDDRSLKALLQSERTNALGVDASKLSEERAKALDYYNGDMSKDMPSAPGRSVAVSTDVSDTVEGLMPALMDIFASTEEVVRFDPVGEEDEPAAEQETDYVNHVFMQKNPGFMVLYSFIKDALLSKVGIVKIYWDKYEKEERETFIGQDDATFAVLASSPDVQVVEHTEHKDEGTGEITHDVTLASKRDYACARVDPVPPEEFGISKNARRMRDATYAYHERKDRTQADLIAAGYDKAQIESLPSFGDDQKTEELARDTVEDDQVTADVLNKAARPLKVTEHYILMDYEEDGKTALYRVTTAGDGFEVLKREGKKDIERVDAMPFAVQTPVPVTHRFFGRSIADLVMDIQRIKTALLRGMLDNIYLTNNQRIEVSESHAHERTLDDLLVNRPGGVIRTKAPGGLNPLPNQPIGNIVLPAIEYMDATREWRTGVTRQGQGIDANALQNQSATAVNQAFTAAQARMKLIARILAETGIRDMFSLLHACIRKNDRKVNTVRMRNKWVPIDPRVWKTRDDMTINVGLGDGSRPEQVQHLMMVLGLQKEAMQLPQLGLVTPKNIYNTASKLVERVGLKSVEPYFTDPATNPMAGQQPPNPKMEEVKGKLTLQAQKQQADQQSDAFDAMMKMQMARMQADMEARLKIREQDIEASLKRMEIIMDAMVGAKQAQASANIGDVKMGGQVG